MNNSENHSNTPFIRKLSHILSEPIYNSIITWDSTGTMIDILDQKKIQTQILPKFFRHNKFESFIRQLNLYGFKKMKKAECHRFKHADLSKGNCLFSIKSQRKIKNIAEQKNKTEFEQCNNSIKESNSIKDEFESNQQVNNQKQQNRETQYGNSKTNINNSENIQTYYQNLWSLYQMNAYPQNFYIPYPQNAGNYGVQNRYFPTYNNIIFYN